MNRTEYMRQLESLLQKYFRYRAGRSATIL